MDIFAGFPYKEIRDQQAEILRFIKRNEDKRVFLLNAPTGVGKSGLAIAIAKYFGKNAWLLTDTKALQDQYETEFPKDVRLIKGKSSYTCNLNRAFMVDQAPCVGHPETKKGCITRSFCDYYSAFNRAIEAKIAVTNYDFLFGLSEINNNEITARDVVICDEGHVLEDKLVKSASFDINPRALYEKYKVDVDPALNFLDFEDVPSVCKHIYACIQTRLTEIATEIAKLPETNLNSNGQRTEVNVAELRLLRVEKYLRSLTKRISSYSFEQDIENKWVTDMDEAGTVLTISPLRADELFLSYFDFKLTNDITDSKIIIMSATLGDPDTIISELGLDPEYTCYIDVDTPFDPVKSPVVMIPRFKLGYKDFNYNKRALVNQIDELLEMHENEKGIIHSGNYRVAEYIAKTTKHKDRLIFKEQGSITSNNDLFLIHCMDDRPTVLISPSMHTGVDLKGELSGFQIIAKLPFANLMDARVKAKMEADKLWYSNQTWMKVIQACGRSTRTSDDESITYILDAAVKYQYESFKSHLPTWFKKRVQFL